jgi:hypothetical protein
VIPDPGYGTSGSNPYYGWTTAGLDYYCGIVAIMSAIENEGLGSNPVTDWEAWNEPNGATQSNSNGGGYNGSLGPCTSTACKNENPPNGYPSGPCASQTFGGVNNDCGGQVVSGYLCYTSNNDCGPTEAGELWELAVSAAATWFPSKNFTIAAGTISDAQNTTYLGGYEGPLIDSYTCTPGYVCQSFWPGTWSVHDYEDPSSGASGASGDISAFTNALSNDIGPGSNVWITESADNLGDTVESDKNRATAAYPFSVWPGCTSFENDHINGNDGNAEFGMCTDQQPGNQTTAANSFLNLGSHGNGNTITQVDWYEFQPTNYSGSWDSGLLSAPTGTYTSPDGLYSQPRESYCALTHGQYTSCSSSTTDAADWSTNPGGSGN